jgi:spermidine synthase
MNAVATNQPNLSDTNSTESSKFEWKSFQQALPVLIIAVLLAACSIVYELLIAQTLASLAANTVRWYSLSVGVFLVSMGMGAFLYSWVPKSISRFRLLFWIEIGLILVGASVVAGVHVAHMLFGYLYVRGYDPSALFVFLAIPLLISTVIGVLSGFEMPILMDYARERRGERGVHEVLAADYFGSLIGALLFPLVFLTYFHIFEIGLFTAFLNAGIALWLFGGYLWKGVWSWVFQVVALGAVVSALVMGVMYREEVKSYFLKKYYFYLTSTQSLETLFDAMPDFPKVLSVQSPYQRIDVVHDTIGSVDDRVIELFSTKLSEDPNFPLNHILFLNGDFQTNTLHEEIYHEWFAHVPIILRKKIPERVLVLGGGDGYLMRELVKYDEIKEIVHIDLDASLVDLAKKNPVLRHVNEGSFDDPRVHTSFRDGFQYVRTTDEKFPAVYIDFPVPNDYNLSKLYSSEFYSFVKQILTSDGFAVFDASGIGFVSLPDGNGVQYLEDATDWSVYYNTVKDAGFPVIMPYLSTLGYHDEALYTNALSRYDLLQTPMDGIVGVPATTRRALRLAAIRPILAEYILSLQQGFLLMAKDPSLYTQEYWKPPVPFHVMNEERFRESFQAKFPTSEEADPKHVNSIMLPRFPTTSFWNPRVPW